MCFTAKAHTHNRFTALFPGQPGWADARKLLDFMVQEQINRGRHTDHPAGRHSIQTNQCSPPPFPHFLQAGCPSRRPTNSVKALKAKCVVYLYRAYQVTILCWSGFYQLHQLHDLQMTLPRHSSHAVWTTATRCCMVCPTASSVSCSQSRMLRHVWLLVPDGVITSHQFCSYKVACLVHQSLSGHAPRYPADDINLVANSGRHLLRSAYDRTFAVHRTYTSFHGRSFRIAEPRVWNVLPSSFATRH